MKMQNDKLLPCPFCSNKDVRLQHRGRTQYGYYVICKNCGCRTPLYQYQFDSKEKRREDAIKQWNTRKPMERIVEQLEDRAEEHRNIAFDMEAKGFSGIADKQYAKQLACINAIDIVRNGGKERMNG
jgi:Lar family restriction alleviation protein